MSREQCAVGGLFVEVLAAVLLKLRSSLNGAEEANVERICKTTGMWIEIKVGGPVRGSGPTLGLGGLKAQGRL